MKKSRSAETFAASAVKVHPHAWLWEPLADDATFVLRSMFGAKAVYLDGKLMLAFCAGEEPWRGLLVCTGREHHDALVRDFPELSPHAILPKWLYLSEASPHFETVGAALVQRARQRDARLGVMPQPRAKRRERARRGRNRPR